MEACPRGHVPLMVERDQEAGTTRIEMAPEVCGGCPFRDACPINKTKDGCFKLEFTDKDHRLAGRRREQHTPVFTERYPALGHRVDQQRIEESAGVEASSGARSRQRVSCDSAQSDRLERAASGGVGEICTWVSGRVAQTLKRGESGPIAGLPDFVLRLWKSFPAVLGESERRLHGLKGSHAA